MRSIRSYIFRLTHATPERKASRAHLRRAKTGDTDAYLSLSAKYLNLSLVYFGNCLHEASDNRLERVERIFIALRQNLAYAKRLSDFEYMLASALLENTPKNGSITSSHALVTKLRLLAPKNRFAFFAYEFENWPLRWVALLMRIRPRLLHRLLSEARCELCGVSWESLDEGERACLERISFSMNRSPNLRSNKDLSRRVSSFPRVNKIKALWLELRPELVEVRHRYLPSQKEREHLLSSILKGVQSSPMNRIPIMDRVVNTLQFARHEKIKVS